MVDRRKGERPLARGNRSEEDKLRPLWLRHRLLERLAHGQLAGFSREQPIGRHTLCCEGVSIPSPALGPDAYVKQNSENQLPFPALSFQAAFLPLPPIS